MKHTEADARRRHPTAQMGGGSALTPPRIVVEEIEPGTPEWFFNRADPTCEGCNGRGLVGSVPCPCTEVDPP